jgi:FMN-dependent NADH-azoreductase
MKLLHIDSSITGADSVSRALTRNAVAEWVKDYPETEVDYLDLAVDAPSHLSVDSLGFRLPPSSEALSDVQRQENALSEALVSQFLAADVIVIGAPLYNFSIPTQLKAWIDRIAQAGRTFKYTEAGAVGLAGGKTIIIALSRGGIYSTSEAGRAMEHQESYLQTMFGFFGISDIRVVRAEGVNLGGDTRESAMASALETIKAIATRSFQTEDAAEAA